MRLKELNQMIKEEFTKYMREQEMPISVEPGTDVMPPMGGEMPGMPGPEGGDAEGTLKNIFDMLTVYFEGGDEDMGGEDMEDEDMSDVGADDEEVEDVEGEDDEEADLEENSTKEAKYQKTGYAAGGKGSTKNAPYTKTAGKGSTKNAGYDASSKALQERLQKLANIIK